MTTKRPLKLLPVWLAISAAVIIAGIILMALLGFNTSPDRAKSYELEVRYDVTVEINADDVAAVEKKCDEVLAANSLTPADRRDGYDSTVNMTVITYVFGEKADKSALEAAEAALNTSFAQDFKDAEVVADAHETEAVTGLGYEQMWRGAVALTVGAVVGLIYIGIRFGVGSALTGLCVMAHDAVFTLSLFAIARIPTYAFAPLLFAAIAAVVSMAMWLLQCMKLRDAKKDAADRKLDAAETVTLAWEANWKRILILTAAGIVLFAVSGGIATAGVRLFLLPCVIPMAVPAYSSLLLGPSLHIYVKGAFDKFSANRKPRYFGKKKAEKPAETQSET